MKNKVYLNRFTILTIIALIIISFYNNLSTWVEYGTFDLTLLNTYLTYLEYFLDGFLLAVLILALFSIKLPIRLPWPVIIVGFGASLAFWYITFNINCLGLDFRTYPWIQGTLGIITGLLANGIVNQES